MRLHYLNSSLAVSIRPPALSSAQIDTIGDAYLAVTGCPRSSPAHATDMANFALAMMGIMGRVRQKTGYSNLQIRVGIHSGPLTAGILRSAKRLKYSIYGGEYDAKYTDKTVLFVRFILCIR